MMLQVQAICAAIKHWYDAKCGDQITIENMKKLASGMKVQGRKSIEDVFHLMDKDKSGKVQIDEWLLWVSKKISKDAMWKKMDKASEIMQGECESEMKELGLSHDGQLAMKIVDNLSTANVKNVYDIIDRDNDGYITKDEYLEQMKNKLSECGFDFNSKSKEGKNMIRVIEVYFFNIARTSGGTVKFNKFDKLLDLTQIFFIVVTV